MKSDKRTIQGGVGGAPQPVVTKPAANVAAPAATKAAPSTTVGFTSSILDEPEDEESTRIADVGALAGAFSLAVGAAEGASSDSVSMPADEWFVGINGVPVGPIRLTELRSKAAAGSVTRESLVWRDGFEDWRPLGTFPELVAIVDESLSTARASLTPFVSPVAGAISVSLPESPAAAVSGTDDAGVRAPANSTASRVTAAAVVTDELEAAGVPKRGGTSPAAWIAVAMALLFGLTIGFVLFKNQGASKTIEVVKYVDRPVPGVASGEAAAPVEKGTSTEDPSSADPKNPTKRVSASPKTQGSAAPAESAKGISGLQGLQGLQGLSPNRGPEGNSGPSGTVTGTGQLESAQIQSTIGRYTGSVKRACWQPALDTRDKDAPTTARVNVAITVLPSGSVSNAAVGADPKGYRGLSQCISSRVRGWQFPPSGDTTSFNLPFVFAAQ